MPPPRTFSPHSALVNTTCRNDGKRRIPHAGTEETAELAISATGLKSTDRVDTTDKRVGIRSVAHKEERHAPRNKLLF